VRTGDTSSAERKRMRRRPPHILVTTPESLYVLLGSESGRKMLATTRSVIVDEIHAVSPNKRGPHLALSLERLAVLYGDRLLRIGLSATQNPIDTIARLLVGSAGETASAPDVTTIDIGHHRARDLQIELTESLLEAVMSAEVCQRVWTTLVFVNTRRMAERVARALSERLGGGSVTAHHGSMAKDHRLAAEQKLKHGKLKALVATASLELGIDIGDVDLVC
jgi:ATP-dependent helicase Lhr and Lhr-like helicase